MNGKWNDYSFCSVTHDEVKRGFFLFYSILFYSLSLSVSLRRAPRFSLLAVDILLRSLALGVLSREKNSPFFFKENFRDS
jgi:hypothetical protein